MNKYFDHIFSSNLFENLGKILIKYLSIVLPLFLIINFTVYPFPIIYSRVLTLCTITIIVFLKNPLRLYKKYSWIRIIDYIMILSIIFLFVFFYKELNIMIEGLGFNTPLYQMVLATLAMIIVMEATRRSAGPVLPVMAIILILYTLQRGYSYARIIVEIVSYDGIFGMVFALAISIVFMFMAFGNFLNQANFGNFLLKFGTALTGGLEGGPAKVAVISSAMFGTISGSAVANVVGTGTFTIPMMKNLKFSPENAAAVEASASTGGMIMPPVMAAAAFIMAEILGVPYFEVAKAAILPAIAYYICIYASIDAYAKVTGIKGIPKNERPSLKESMKSGGHLIIIIFILIYLLGTGQTPMKAAFLCILLIFPLSFISKATRLNFKKTISALIGSMEGLLVLVPCCATIGIIIACIGVTGLGGKIANSVISIGGSNQLLVLFLAMVTCLIFGMALPATASYLICISIIGPTLIRVGIIPIGAHLFTLYFAALSGITPPVAMAAYAAAGIANANMFKTAIQACGLTSVAFIMPYIFVYNPSILLKGSILDILLPIVPYIIVLPFSLAWFFWGYKYFTKNLRINRIFNFGISVSLIYSAISRQVFLGLFLAIIWISAVIIVFILNKKGVIK